MLTDSSVVDDEDKHTWLWVGVVVFVVGNKCGLLLGDNLELESENKVGWQQAADLVFKIVEKHCSLPDFDSALGDESGTLSLILMVGFLKSYSMRYVG